MADNKQQTGEQYSNEILKDVFRESHPLVVNNINTSSVIDKLFAASVISIHNTHKLHFIKNPLKKCRRLLFLLHKAKNPRTFIELREAIKAEPSYEWLVEKIDENYRVKSAAATAAAQPEVARVRSNPSLTQNDDIAGLQRDNAALEGNNRRLLDENDRLKVRDTLNVDYEQLSREAFSLKTENSRLMSFIKRLYQQRSENKRRMVLLDQSLDKVIELLRKSRIEAGEDENIEESKLSAASTATDCVITSKLTDEDSAPDMSKLHCLVADLLERLQDIWLTYDVLEPVLLLVAVKLFEVNRLHLFLPRPDVTTLVTVSSVCRDWWEVLKGRKFLRRRLKLTLKESTVLPVELFKAAVLQRNRLVDQPHKTSRDADVIILQSLASVCRRWKAALSESGDLGRRRLKRLFHYNPQLLVTLNEPPTYIGGFPRWVVGTAMLDKCLYVAYSHYNKVEVFDCEDRWKKVNDIEVNEMKSPVDMVGCSVTSQLFIVERHSDAIWRVDPKTGVGDVFNKPGYMLTNLSLVENRLLVTSRDSLLMFDIISGERIVKIPLSVNIKIKGVKFALESKRGSFFVSYGKSFDNNITVSEVDSEGRVIQVFDNKQPFDCGHLALYSVGRLLVADCKNKRVALLDEHLKYDRVIFDNRRLDDARPYTLSYNENNNRQMVYIGLGNGQVKIFQS